jgi:hypothetical protein
MLASIDLASACDPVEMARASGLKLDPWQSRLIRSEEKKVLVCCSRQSGKSTTTAALAIYTAIYTPKSTVLLLSPTLRQSGELFRKCLSIYRDLDKPVKAEAETALRLELENGSRIASLPGKEGTIRGFSAVDLLVIDEASRVEDDLYYSIKPMLAVSNGRLVLLSTPFTCRGFYWEEWKRREKWDYYQVDAVQCPRISKEFLEDEKESIGDFWYRQEYMCEFLNAENAAFRAEDVECIVKQGVETWDL